MIRGILTLMMLLTAYSLASYDEGIESPSDIDLEASYNIFEGTVVDVRDDDTTTYNLIHLRSGDLEWAIRYYDYDLDFDSGLAYLRLIATREALIRVELDCTTPPRFDSSELTVNQGRVLRHIHINLNENSPCQILSSTLL